MSITIDKKKEVVADLTKIFKDSKSVVFYKFHGFKMPETKAMRRKLRAEQIGATVARKTLMKRALSEAGITGELPALEGEIGMAYAVDLTAPAREVYSIQKTAKDSLEIVGGIFEGKFMSKEEMMVIASIPSQKTLYAQFVMLINSPIQRLAVGLDQIAKTKTV
ncbi:MAG: 50S ribosomal protein L10 [bacterium]